MPLNQQPCAIEPATGALNGRTVVYGTATTADELLQLAEDSTYVLHYHHEPLVPATCEWCGNEATAYYIVEPNQAGEPTVAYHAAEVEITINGPFMHLAPCVEMHCERRWQHHTNEPPLYPEYPAEHAMGAEGCVWANPQY